MSKRITPEEQVVDYFMSTPSADSVRTMFNIVKGIVTQRGIFVGRKATKRTGKRSNASAPAVDERAIVQQ